MRRSTFVLPGTRFAESRELNWSLAPLELCAMAKNQKSAPQQEADFLAEQSRLAKLAIKTVFDEMEQNLARAADVRAWTVRYPWPSVATAAAGGAAAGIAVKSMVSSNGKSTNGNGHFDHERMAELHVEVSPEKPSHKKSAGTLASGLRWLATGLATAAAEAFFAATSEQLQSALKQPNASTPREPATSA